MKIVAILSGGMDSSTMVAKLKAEGHDIHCLTFDYQQRHIREIKSASAIANYFNLPHIVTDIPGLLLSGSAITSNNIDVPEGHYADENMKATVVPNRNMILLSLAIGYAISINAEAVAYGAHGGDHDIYPDCRKEFVDAMREVAKLCDYKPMEILTPYIDTDKIGILKEGLELGVPYELTWTCYKGLKKACGKCGSCVERLEAFEKNNVKDPLSYEGEEE